MDKLNRINVNIGAVNNELQKNSAKQEKKEMKEKVEEKPVLRHENIDPDKLLEAMKKHGAHNLNHVMISGKVACKTITDAMDLFTNNVTPEMHGKLTERVKAVFKTEFPAAQMDPELITEVVDTIIFDALTA